MLDPNIVTVYNRARALRAAQKNYVADGTRNEILGNEVRLRGEELDAALDALLKEGYVPQPKVVY